MMHTYDPSKLEDLKTCRPQTWATHSKLKAILEHTEKPILKKSKWMLGVVVHAFNMSSGNLCQFQATLAYIVSCRSARAM